MTLASVEGATTVRLPAFWGGGGIQCGLDLMPPRRAPRTLGKRLYLGIEPCSQL